MVPVLLVRRVAKIVVLVGLMCRVAPARPALWEEEEEEKEEEFIHNRTRARARCLTRHYEVVVVRCFIDAIFGHSY